MWPRQGRRPRGLKFLPPPSLLNSNRWRRCAIGKRRNADRLANHLERWRRQWHRHCLRHLRELETRDKATRKRETRTESPFFVLSARGIRQADSDLDRHVDRFATALVE